MTQSVEWSLRRPKDPGLNQDIGNFIYCKKLNIFIHTWQTLSTSSHTFMSNILPFSHRFKDLVQMPRLFVYFVADLQWLSFCIE